MARLSQERRMVEEAQGQSFPLGPSSTAEGRTTPELTCFNPLLVEDSSFVDLALEASETVKTAVKGGDPSFRVEKYLISWVRHFIRLAWNSHRQRADCLPLAPSV